MRISTIRRDLRRQRRNYQEVGWERLTFEVPQATKKWDKKIWTWSEKVPHFRIQRKFGFQWNQRRDRCWECSLELDAQKTREWSHYPSSTQGHPCVQQQRPPTKIQDSESTERGYGAKINEGIAREWRDDRGINWQSKASNDERSYLCFAWREIYGERKADCNVSQESNWSSVTQTQEVEKGGTFSYSFRRKWCNPFSCEG